MRFTKVAINQNFKKLNQITDLYNRPQDLVTIYNNMKIGYPSEHSADTFSTRKEVDANNQLLKYPNDLLRDRVGSCIEHALFMHYFCEASSVYTKIAIIQTVAEYEDLYYIWGHAICFIKLDTDKTGLFMYNFKKSAWEILVTNHNIDDSIEISQKLMKIGAQRFIYNDKNYFSSVFFTKYNCFCIDFDKYDTLGKAYDAHYNKKDITRIDFYYKYIAKELKKKYGKEYINTDKKSKKYVYLNTNIGNVLGNIYDSLLILLKINLFK